jgi:hypothetical protein
MATWRHAFSLSKEELRDCEPPGTVRLIGTCNAVGPIDANKTNTKSAEHELHRTTTGTTVFDGDHILLLPKPSRSPADPLNWSRKRRWAILFTMCFYALAADFAAGAVASALPIMEFQFVPHTSISKLSQLVAVSDLFIDLEQR